MTWLSRKPEPSPYLAKCRARIAAIHAHKSPLVGTQIKLCAKSNVARFPGGKLDGKGVCHQYFAREACRIKNANGKFNRQRATRCGSDDRSKKTVLKGCFERQGVEVSSGVTCSTRPA